MTDWNTGTSSKPMSEVLTEQQLDLTGQIAFSMGQIRPTHDFKNFIWSILTSFEAAPVKNWHLNVKS